MKWLQAGLVIVAQAAVAQAADWPQWLGPQRDGGTTETVAPWSEPPKELWRRPVGPGYSAPVVSGGRVFVHSRVEFEEAEELVALDAATGEVRWRDAYARPAYQSKINTGPQATPTVAGGRVYAYGVNGMLGCWEAATGKRLWQVDALKQLGATAPRYGVCCSPLVVGNRVLASVGGKGSSLVSFDSESGEVQWQAFDDPASTASPVLFAPPGGKPGALPDVVFMTSLRLLAVNPLDGALRWEHPLVFQPAGASPTPLVAGDVLVASSMTNGSTALRIGREEEAPSVAQAWQQKDFGGYFSSGAASKDRFHLVTNVLQPLPSASLRCIDFATGEERWTKKGVGYFHAGLIRLGDDKLLVLSDNGFLKLVDSDPKAFKELCSAQVCSGTLVNPALADGRIYVRDEKELVCFQLAPPSKP